MSAKKDNRGSGAGAASGGGAKTTAMLIRFERWYAGHAAGAGHEHPSASDATALLSALFVLSRGRLHEPVVSVLEGVLAEVEASGELAPRLPDVIEVLEHYLDFAVETGTWRASDAVIDESSEYLEVAYDVSTGLLLYLIDALDDVADVPEDRERAALAALPQAGASTSASALTDRVLAVFETGDPASVPGALALERVLGLLCVAVSPGLLPGATTAQILGMLDTAAGVTPEQAAAAGPLTDDLLTELERLGLIAPVAGAGGGRLEAPAGIRAALADAVVAVADEFGLLDDEGENPHPEGTVLEVLASVADTAPAEWRRLQIAAESDLGALHLAIQLSFDWANTEEHSFVSVDEPETVYAPVGLLGSDADGRSGGGTGDDGQGADESAEIVDENEVEIGEFLVADGDEIEYRYGDVDPRRVVIALKSVGEATETVLPRCVAASAGVDAAEADRLLAPLRIL